MKQAMGTAVLCFGLAAAAAVPAQDMMRYIDLSSPEMTSAEMTFAKMSRPRLTRRAVARLPISPARD